MKRWALRASLPLALLLLAAPGASAASCTAAASGAWTAPATWSCGVVPGAADAVLIPAGKSVSIAADDTQNAGKLTLRGTLALGDQAELDADGLAAGGGTISGPQYAMLVVTTDTGTQATVESSGLTVDGAYLNVTGDGTFAVAGPLSLNDGGWVESDIDAIWTGSAPWRIGGAAGSPPSGFEVFGAQLTITGTTAAQPAGAGDGVIQLDGGTTLVKTDATTSDLGIDVLIDTAKINVLAGKLMGEFQGAGSLAVAAGATLVLGGSGVQVAPPAVDVAGGTIEVEPDADVSLVLPGEPALHRLAVGAGASLDVSIDNGSAPGAEAAPPNALGDEVAIAAGATLSITAGGGTLALAAHDVLSGSGTLDASLENGGGTVEPSGALHVTGNYTQGAGATLALDLRSAADADSLRVGGATALAGTLAVTTKYTPAKAAAQLVLGAASKPTRDVREGARPAPCRAGLGSGLRRDRRHARRHRGRQRTGVADAALAAAGGSRRRRPHALPARQVDGRAHADLPVAARRQADRAREHAVPACHAGRSRTRAGLPRDGDRDGRCACGGREQGRPRARRSPHRRGHRQAGRRRLGGARVSCERADLPGLPARARRGSRRRERPLRRALAGRRSEAGGGRLGGTARRCRGRARELPQCQGRRARDQEPERPTPLTAASRSGTGAAFGPHQGRSGGRSRLR